MVLNFTPPTDLVNAYLNRPSPGEIASQGVQQALQTYASEKDKQKTEALAQQAKDIEMAKGLAGSGQDFMDAYKQIVAARTPSPTTPGTSLIDRAKAFFGGQPKPTSSPPVPSSSMPPQMSTPTVSGMQSVPPPPSAIPPIPISSLQSPSVAQSFLTPTGELDQAALDAYKKQHGTQGLANLDKQLSLSNTLRTAAEKRGKKMGITKEEVLKSGYDPQTQVIVEPPAPRLDIGTKQEQFDQKEWDKIVKETNPLTASSRSTLGMASKANFQADRALVTLSKPVVTNQEAGNVMADIAAIYQTGSPTQYGMSHQEYSTLYGKIQGALQTITGKPQDSLPDAIKQRLVGVLHDMKGTNGAVLKQQLDFTEKAKKRIISKFPQEWQDIRATLENNQTPTGQPTIPGTGPHGASVSQNGHIYNWNPKTGQYE